MSSKNISSSIRLRADTISNWILNRTKTLPLNELSIIKFDDGTISFKLGAGNTYSNTNYVKFQNLCVTGLTDGTYTFSFPSKSGIFALASDLESKADQTDLASLQEYSQATVAALQSEVAERVLLGQTVANKVDKETGKGLSTNDYTTEEKTKLAGLSNYDDTEVRNLISNKVDKNTDITAATKCKITYDSKGLVTSGSDLTESDIPSLPQSKITNLSSDLTSLQEYSQATVAALQSEVAERVLLGQTVANKVDKVEGSSLVADSKVTSYDSHISNTDIHVTTSDKTNWNNKVDQVTGKGLSTNDYTTEEKTKLAGLSNYDDTEVKESIQANTSAIQSEVAERVLLAQTVANKLDKNTDITSATKCKITYDSKGLVTAGSDLTESDIPNISQSKITNLSTDLGNKVDKVTGSSLVADTKITSYDSHISNTDIHVTTSDKTNWDNKVDQVSGKGLSTEDYTTEEKTKLAGLSPITIDSAMSDSSENAVQNKVIKAYVDAQITSRINLVIDEIMNEQYGNILTEEY